MAIYACGCLCGSTESLIRNFLKQAGYEDWLSLPIEMGKERSIKLMEYLPNLPELQMLSNYLANLGKWAVIIGVKDGVCRWSDISRDAPNSTIEATHIVEFFA